MLIRELDALVNNSMFKKLLLKTFLLFLLFGCDAKPKPHLNIIAEKVRIEKQYNEVILHLESLKEKTGKYPATLSVDFQQLLSKEKLKSKYHSSGNYFQLSFGDYAKDGFTIYYSSEIKKWATNS